MSPEDKVKRAAIFRKMALRDKLEAFRKRQSLGVLRDELSKNRGVRDQLKNLVKKPHPLMRLRQQWLYILPLGIIRGCVTSLKWWLIAARI